ASIREYGSQAIAPYTDVPPDLLGYRPAISAYVADCTIPKVTERVHTSQETAPTVAEMSAIESRTSAGTPLAIQTAPFQETWRCRPSTSSTPTVETEFLLLSVITTSRLRQTPSDVDSC